MSSAGFPSVKKGKSSWLFLIVTYGRDNYNLFRKVDFDSYLLICILLNQ